MLLLLILDGWGYSKEKHGNAIAAAKTPFLDSLKKRYPNSLLETSGEAVGLPVGQMGGSEVGHLTIGAGRIIPQKLTEIDNSIKDGSFFQNKIFLEKIKQLKKRGKAVHFLGLFSKGGVHSDIKHLKALIKVTRNEKIIDKKIFIHAFLDGRDVSPTQGIVDLKEWEDSKEKGIGLPKISSLIGRYYAMDRDKRWKRTEVAYNALINRIGEKSKGLIKSLKESYKKGITDEFIKPIISDNFQPIQDGDLVVFYNFRPDRARQLSFALSEDNFSEFKRKKFPKIEILSLVEYDKNFNFPNLFPIKCEKETLGEILSKNNLKQLRIAETEKYAHVTYFFSGGREKSFDGEDRVLIPSPKVATYDLKPEMSAFEITEKLIEAIKNKKYDFILANYANLDMVGHTGNLKATVKAVEAIDICLKKIFENLEKNDKILITADHGNAEKVLDKNGEVFTAHTTNPVPFIYIDNSFDRNKIKTTVKNGELADIAPTILNIMKIKKPDAMTGKTLIKNPSDF